MSIKYCRTCGLFDSVHSVCQLTRRQKDAENDFCSEHKRQDQLCTCSVCHKYHLGPQIVEVKDDGRVVEYCPECSRKVTTCEMCEFGGYCRFEHDQSINLPLKIFQTVRMGNALVKQEAPNPKRISVTCKAGCVCWNGESCNRDLMNWCAKHKEKQM